MITADGSFAQLFEEIEQGIQNDNFKFAVTAVQKLSIANPKLTGKSAANWHVGRREDGRVFPAKGPSRSIPQATNRAKKEGAFLRKEITDFVISNNVDYTIYLILGKDGRQVSKKAPLNYDLSAVSNALNEVYGRV